MSKRERLKAWYDHQPKWVQWAIGIALFLILC